MMWIGDVEERCGCKDMVMVMLGCCLVRKGKLFNRLFGN